ncbi:MAG: class I SAM-dependent methyltransferase [Anaeroplasmataceae bacterium]
MKNYHYYSEKQEDLKSNPNDFTLFFKEHKFIFTTDNGVFSKKYLDFGSHTLLSAFEPNEIDAPILDVGCGYGPLGIVISTLYEKEVLMVDINERAIELTNKNIVLNNASKAKAQKSYLYDSLDKNMRFSSIVTNPPIRAGKKIVFEIYEKAYDYLCDGGELWVVIQKKQGASSSMDHIKEIFGNCEIVCKNKGYYILKSVK